MLTDDTSSRMSTSSVEEEEEEITSHTITSVNDFKDSVKKMCQLQDEMKVIAAKRKEINDVVNEIKLEVKDYMIQNNVKVCNYDTDEIYVNKREKVGSLTRTSLRAALESHFGEETATDAFAYIIEKLGSTEVLELKRAKRKAEPKPKATGGAKTKKQRITNNN